MLYMSIDIKLAATRSTAMTTALAVGRRSCWLAMFAAVALVKADPVNKTAPPTVSRANAAPAAIPLAPEFEQAVVPQLRPPQAVVVSYAFLLQGALDSAGVRIERPQFVALVDRSPKVQAVLLLWGSASTGWRLVGAGARVHRIARALRALRDPAGRVRALREQPRLSC